MSTPDRLRKIQVTDTSTGSEANITLNNPGMDHLSQVERKAMTLATLTFVACLLSAVDDKSLTGTRTTTRNVLFHTLHRLGQVGKAMEDGSINGNPEDSEPSLGTIARKYVRDLTMASVQTQEGIEQAQRRLVLYAQTGDRLADRIASLEGDPSSTNPETLTGLRQGFFDLTLLVQGMDEALSLIQGKSPATPVPQHIENLIRYFNPPDSSNPQPNP
ncbi:hypothetical protein HYW41_02350 [Candidatus Daviesbacteria bacterium]|nr:hypothetical protein [Candidatus Daviesbacteria bacterium]